MTEIGLETLIYLAGYFDGEGCVSSSGTKPIIATVTSADEETVKLFYKYFGGTFGYPKRQKNTKRAVCRWAVAGNSAQYFLLHIIPWLRAKKEVSLLALGPTYIKSNKTLSEIELQKRRDTKIAITAINQRITFSPEIANAISTTKWPEQENEDYIKANSVLNGDYING